MPRYTSPVNNFYWYGQLVPHAASHADLRALCTSMGAWAPTVAPTVEELRAMIDAKMEEWRKASVYALMD